MKDKTIVYQQTDEPFVSYIYGTSTLGEVGCGILSIINAVEYLTGNVIDYKQLADWASKEQYVPNVGTKHTIAKEAANIFGKSYLFDWCEYFVFSDVGIVTEKGYPKDEKTYNCIWKKLLSILIIGQVAIALVEGHFIAIVDYDPITNKVLVLDSSATENRGTTIFGDWKSKKELDYNSTLGMPKLKLRSSLTFLCKRE